MIDGWMDGQMASQPDDRYILLLAKSSLAEWMKGLRPVKWEGPTSRYRKSTELKAEGSCRSLVDTEKWAFQIPITETIIVHKWMLEGRGLLQCPEGFSGAGGQRGGQDLESLSFVLETVGATNTHGGRWLVCVALSATAQCLRECFLSLLCSFIHSCKAQQNLNSFFAIVMGLNTASVSRLSQTWEVSLGLPTGA